MSSEPKGHDMSRSWRLVSVEGGCVTGTFWVAAPSRKCRQVVKAVDVLVWVNEERIWGRVVTDMTAFVEGGEVHINPRMIDEQVRDDVLAQIDAMKSAVKAAADAVEWGEDDETDDE